MMVRLLWLIGWLLGPTFAAWLLTGLALVVVLPLGAAPRRDLHGWPRRYTCALLGPLVWWAYRRRLLATAGAAYQPRHDLRSPIVVFAVWTAATLLASAWPWLDDAAEVAQLRAQGEYWGDTVQLMAVDLVLRLAPLVLTWLVVSALLVLDLALILMRRARYRGRAAGSVGAVGGQATE